jgi:hypothetical protein
MATGSRLIRCLATCPESAIGAISGRFAICDALTVRDAKDPAS